MDPLPSSPEKIAKKLRHPCFTERITQALELMHHTLLPQLPASEGKRLVQALEKAGAGLLPISQDPNPCRLYTPEELGLTEETLLTLAQFAQQAQEEHRPKECAQLLALMSLLHPTKAEYWLRLGTAEQALEEFEKAQLAYATCSTLAPQFALGCLLCAQCHLALEELSQAQEALEEGEKRLKGLENVPQKWKELHTTLQQELAT